MTVVDSAVGLTSSQRRSATVIDDVLKHRGVPREVIAAAIVNAYAESGLNPAAVGDGGRSVGLFQLHERGAGHGMSAKARMDPAKNTERIYTVYAGKYGQPIRTAYNDGERSIPVLSALWSTHVERPANKKTEEVKRRAIALRLFPSMVAIESASGSIDPRRIVRRWFVFTAASGFFIVAAITWRARGLPSPSRRHIFRA